MCVQCGNEPINQWGQISSVLSDPSWHNLCISEVRGNMSISLKE